MSYDISAQNTPWDIIYCLNGGENKSAGISTLPEPNPPEKPGWNLIFSDEFQAGSLNPGYWNRSNPWDDGDGSCRRGFSANPDNILVENGNAVIINSIDEQLPGCPYSFGEIKSMSIRDSAFKSYYFYAPGYLETRVKLFTKTGQGAACWLWGIGTPENPGVPGPWNEIDIFELNGINTNIFNGAYHWTSNGIHVSQHHSIYLTDSSQLYDLTANWTTFGLEWDTASIKWFVNNHLVKELDLSAIPPFCIKAEHYSAPKAPLSLRLWTGWNTVGNQSGVPDPADFPQSMLVDYVRMYKKAGHKASPVIIPDGKYQICATAISPESSEKIITSRYYPDASYEWSSPAFELEEVSSPIPQPPWKMLMWIKPGITSGQSYPVYLETHFAGNYSEYDTAYIYIAQDIPDLPPDDFSAIQVDTLCRFAIQTPALPGISGCDFSLDGGSNWTPGTLIHQEGVILCSFGKFSPEQQVDFAFREQNGCGYSPVLYSSLTMPIPPVGCKWPTGVDDSLPGFDQFASALVSVWPNQVESKIHVRISLKFYGQHKNISLKIYDVHARKVLDQNLPDPDNELNLSFLKPGIYCLHILADKTAIHKSVFIKIRE